MILDLLATALAKLPWFGPRFERWYLTADASWDDETRGDAERDPDQAYYWTPEWQAGVAESRRAFDAGECFTFSTAEEVVFWLRSDEDPPRGDAENPSIP